MKIQDRGMAMAAVLAVGVTLAGGMGCLAMASADGSRDGKDDADASATAERAAVMEVAVAVKVPDAAWRVSIEEIYRSGEGYLVIARLHRPVGMMGAMVISTARDAVSVPLTPLPTKILVHGKTWRWDNPEPYQFFATRAELDAALGKDNDAPVWRRSEAINPKS
jgi:hypothetical protein